MSDEILNSRLEGTKLIIETTDGTQSYDSQFLVAALLVFVARGSGQIEPEESAKMIELIENHFQLQGAESLELITMAMSEMADKRTLVSLLTDLGPTLSEGDKEDIALMGLKVVAADGRREFDEMEQFNKAMEAIGIAHCEDERWKSWGYVFALSPRRRSQWQNFLRRALVCPRETSVVERGFMARSYLPARVGSRYGKRGLTCRQV
jgi:uncharacterized tellurite resistance protein B-like protein